MKATSEMGLVTMPVRRWRREGGLGAGVVGLKVAELINLGRTLEFPFALRAKEASRIACPAPPVVFTTHSFWRGCMQTDT